MMSQRVQTLSVEHLEFVALCFEPFDGAGQGIAQLLITFHRVVEGDDAAGTCVALDVAQYVGAVESFGIVAGHEIPHHDLVVVVQLVVLPPSHPAMRRSDQIGVEVLVGLLDVLQILRSGMAKSAQVVEGVIAQAVSVCHDLSEDVGMLADIVAHHEESRPHLIFTKHLKHPGRHLGDGAVVKGQIDSTLLGMDAPECLRI